MQMHCTLTSPVGTPHSLSILAQSEGRRNLAHPFCTLQAAVSASSPSHSGGKSSLEILYIKMTLLKPSHWICQAIF